MIHLWNKKEANFQRCSKLKLDFDFLSVYKNCVLYNDFIVLAKDYISYSLLNFVAIHPFVSYLAMVWTVKVSHENKHAAKKKRGGKDFAKEAA